MINMKRNKPFWRFLISSFQRKNWRSASAARRERQHTLAFWINRLVTTYIESHKWYILQDLKKLNMMRNWWWKGECITNFPTPMAPGDAIQGPTATRSSHPFRVWHGTCGNFFYWRKHCTLGPFVDGIGFRRATWTWLIVINQCQIIGTSQNRFPLMAIVPYLQEQNDRLVHLFGSRARESASMSKVRKSTLAIKTWNMMTTILNTPG